MATELSECLEVRMFELKHAVPGCSFNNINLSYQRQLRNIITVVKKFSKEYLLVVNII